MIGKTGQPVQGLTAIGNGEDNRVVGNAYDNNLQGRWGHDTLTGNAGADSFIFSSRFGDDNVDTITDFGNGADRLVISRAIEQQFASGPLPGTAFYLGAEAHDADDRYVFDGRTLWYDPDGSGNAEQIAVAILEGHPTLTAADIIIG